MEGTKLYLFLTDIKAQLISKSNAPLDEVWSPVQADYMVYKKDLRGALHNTTQQLLLTTHHNIALSTMAVCV